MKTLFLVFAALLGLFNATHPPCTNTHPRPHEDTYEVPCNILITSDIVLNFRRALYETITVLFRKTAALSDGHFTFSPYTIWMALAAIAEGSEGQTREELYHFLSLPEDKCLRQIYYQLASTREVFSHYVALERKRLFIADSSLILNRNWQNYIKAQRLIDVVQTPYKSDHVAKVESWKRMFNAQLPNLNLNGNSLILESLDYSGLWTSAFSDVTVIKEPFYNVLGETVASIEYMKMRKHANMAYIPSLNMKILELPVGRSGRYTMLFALVMGDTSFKGMLDTIHSSIIIEALRNFKRSPVPIEVVIPRITMTSEIDVRKLLEDVGVTGMWMDPYATRNILVPAALPSSFVQRVTVTLDSSGDRPTIQEYSNFIPSVPSEASPYSGNATGLDPVLGQDFIANRPFLFGLFDTDTYICLFASSFSKPT